MGCICGRTIAVIEGASTSVLVVVAFAFAIAFSLEAQVAHYNWGNRNRWRCLPKSCLGATNNATQSPSNHTRRKNATKIKKRISFKYKIQIHKPRRDTTDPKLVGHSTRPRSYINVGVDPFIIIFIFYFFSFRFVSPLGLWPSHVINIWQKRSKFTQYTQWLTPW